MSALIPELHKEPEPIGKRHGSTFIRPPDTTVLLLWLLLITGAVELFSRVSSPDIHLAPFLIFLPYVVSGAGTVRQTLLAAVWVVTVLTVTLLYRPLATPFGTVTSIVFGVVLGALSVWRCRARIRKEQEILRLRSAAVALQEQVLPPLPWRTGRYVIQGLYEPLVEESRIGGDLYDIAISPYGMRVLIADVQGKGLFAIGTAFEVLGAFREAAHREPTLNAVAAALDDAVVRHNTYAEHLGRMERFVTALVLSLDYDGSVQAQAVNCGHIPMYLFNGDQCGPALCGDPGVPLGLGFLAREPRTVEWFDFPCGATLLLCTDGVTEARSPTGDFFPLHSRLPAWSGLPPDALIDAIRTELRDFSKGDVQDDITVLTVRHTTAT